MTKGYIAVITASTLTIMLIAIGAFSGKLNALRPVYKDSGISGVISPIESKIAYNIDNYIKFCKEKAELEKTDNFKNNVKVDTSVYNVRTDELSVRDIADETKVPDEDLAEFNGVDTDHHFKKGDKVYIPQFKNEGHGGNG